MPYVDLSHTIEDGMVTYPGLPAPRISDHLTFEESRAHYGGRAEFHIGRIDMVANTGTYLDTPAHRWRDGADLADLDLSQVAGLRGVVIRDPGPDLGPELVHGLDLEKAALVGIDSVNIDATEQGNRPTHSILLEAGILIVEHLTRLDRVPDDGFEFSAVSVKVRGLGTFPVRAFASW
jgi:kynurenine formamidase